MTDKVILSISTHQDEFGDDGDLQILIAADYYYKNGKHYLIYTDNDPDTHEEIRNTIKIDKNRVDVIRRGASEYHMVFEVGSRSLTDYETPIGLMMVELDTDDIVITEGEDKVNAQVDYSLYINESFISACQVCIDIKARKSLDMELSLGRQV